MKPPSPSPTEVQEMWLSTLDFLSHNAPLAWASMMDGGIGFTMPPAVRGLSSSAARGAALAQAEYERLAAAELFHFDASAAEAAVKAEPQAQSLAELAPSASGLIVWEVPPYTVSGGIPVVAATWGIAYDGGTWMSWWTHTATAVRAHGLPPQILGINGHLTFHEEVHMPPKGWPVLAEGPDYAPHRALLTAWTAIDTAAVEEGEPLPPAPHDRKYMRRAGLEPRSVRTFRAGAGPARASDPAVIIRRTIGGMVVAGRTYPGELPDELMPWHCYTADGGHSLLVVLDPVDNGTNVAGAAGGSALEDAFVPAPVKAVLKAGWTVEGGLIHSPLRYDSNLGVLTDPEDDEF